MLHHFLELHDQHVAMRRHRRSGAD
jgi:hypothetical protein